MDVRVIGGPRGFTACCEDIRAAAAELESMAHATRDALALTPHFGELGLDDVVRSPATWAAYEAEVFAFTRMARPLPGRLLEIAHRARWAARRYASVESGVGAWVVGWGAGVVVRWTALQWAVPAAVGALTAIGWVKTADCLVERVTGKSPNIGRTLMRAAGELFADAVASGGVSRAIDTGISGFASGLSGMPPLPKSIDPYRGEALTRRLAQAGEDTGAFPTQPPHIVAGSLPSGGRAPQNLSGLYREQVTTHEGRANGHVRVDAVRGADGKRRYIVYVPATTDWSARSGKNTTDTATNVQTMAQRESAMRHVVRAALKRSGIGPEDEVMLVGYSQGGIVAASLAADPAFRASANVRHVVTVGSPVGRFNIEGARVLSIEQDRDVVPALDGTDNPDKRTWTTLVAPTPPGGEPLDAHSSKNYATVIRQMEADGQPDVRDFERDAGDFLNGRVERSDSYAGVRGGG